MASEPYIAGTRATAAPIVTDFAKVTVHWKPSPFPDLVTLIHSRLATPEQKPSYICLSPDEAEQLAVILLTAAGLARRHKTDAT